MSVLGPTKFDENQILIILTLKSSRKCVYWYFNTKFEIDEFDGMVFVELTVNIPNHWMFDFKTWPCEIYDWSIWLKTMLFIVFLVGAKLPNIQTGHMNAQSTITQPTNMLCEHVIWLVRSFLGC